MRLEELVRSRREKSGGNVRGCFAEYAAGVEGQWCVFREGLDGAVSF